MSLALSNRGQGSNCIDRIIFSAQVNYITNYKIEKTSIFSGVLYTINLIVIFRYCLVLLKKIVDAFLC